MTDLHLFVITWKDLTANKTWESERCAHTPMEALKAFRNGLKRLPHLDVAVLGIANADGNQSLALVQ
jgi:hypothetical protein